MTFGTFIFFLFALLTIVMAGWFVLVSYREKEWRAVKHMVAIAGPIITLFFICALFPLPGNEKIAIVLVLLFLVFLLWILLPGKFDEASFQAPRGLVDERDVMFSRMDLKPETKHYEAYYRKHPANRLADDAIRKHPGLLQPGTKFFDAYQFAAANVTFQTVEALHHLVEGKPERDSEPVFPKGLNTFLPQWIKKMGAVSVGVTSTKPYHWYSHRGRGEAYGKPVTNEDTHAIAFTVEMDHEMMSFAPCGPAVMESARQYLNAGAIATQVALFLRQLGYSARAHIDGNYEVICPLVARDAGLGELGRMGLLMTPELGPRVRVAVVTTTAPLEAAAAVEDLALLSFCRICKKCADVCPSSAIPFDDRVVTDGALRWKINSERCFSFWSQVGTDCGRCMQVCPFSHPNTTLHNLVRWGIKRNIYFQKLALSLDDFFYGRKPVVRIPPRTFRFPEA